MRPGQPHLACVPLLLAALLLAPAAAGALSLRAAYEAAGPEGEHDRVLRLETGVVYTGGLQIGPSLVPFHGLFTGEPGCDVRIVGNGAILDLQGQQLCISYCNHRLDIEDCVVVGGNIRFRGLDWDELVLIPTGSVRHVTFYRPHDHGVKLQKAGPGILLERNLCVDAVDTGPDFIYTTGISHEQLPTGTSFAASVQIAAPTMRENWTFHDDPADNLDPLAHFSWLCEYG